MILHMYRIYASCFRRAYPATARGSEEMEQMGQTVLCSQFVLLPEIKSKVAGVEGDLERLLTKARFEEAKIRELAGATRTPPRATAEPNSLSVKRSSNKQICTVPRMCSVGSQVLSVP